MKLLIATLPDKSSSLPGWLEKHLTGLDLADVVAELTAIHGNGPVQRSARAILGQNLAAVLNRGLSALPQETLQTFLRHPSLLFELQEIVLTEGGSFWTDRVQAPQSASTARTGRRLRVSLGLSEPQSEGRHVRLRFYRRPWLVGLSSVAATLLIVYCCWQYMPRQTVSVWQKPEQLAKEGNGPLYLTAVADATDQSWKKPKEDSESVKRVVREIRDGCTGILATDNKSLPAKDREWLFNNCQKWGARFDQYLVDLQDGKDWQAVRDAANETVENMIRTLRQRAEQVNKAPAA